MARFALGECAAAAPKNLPMPSKHIARHLLNDLSARPDLSALTKALGRFRYRAKRRAAMQSPRRSFRISIRPGRQRSTSWVCQISAPLGREYPLQSLLHDSIRRSAIAATARTRAPKKIARIRTFSDCCFSFAGVSSLSSRYSMQNSEVSRLSPCNAILALSVPH